MKDRRTSAVTVMMFSFIMILASIYLPKNTLAANAPTMYLDPSDNQFHTSQMSVGSRFNVTAHVQYAVEIAAWQIYVQYNDDILNVTRWFEPTADANYIFARKTTSPNPTPPNPDYAHLGAGKGRIQVGSMLFPVFQPTSSGNGTLCIIEFVVMQAPTSGQLSCPLRINASATTLLDADGLDIPGIIKQDGTYSLAFDVPPSPYLAVNPSSIVYRPLQNTTDQPLVINILVKDTSASVSLKTVSLSLGYNQSLFSTDSSNVTLDSLWESGNSVTVSEGMINITVTNPTATPNGNVLVGNITLAIVRETSPPAAMGNSSNATLNFVYGLLLNSAGGEIVQSSPINGSVRIYAYRTETATLTITEPAVIGFGRLIIPNKQFQVNVTLGEVFEFLDAQIYVTFNQSIIECSSVDGVSGYTSLVHGETEINNPAGYVRAKVDYGALVGSVLSGPILSLNFTAKAEGSSYIKFSQPYGIDTYVFDFTNALIDVGYVERTVTVSSGNISNIVIGGLTYPTLGVINTANGSISLKQQGPISGSANISFVLNDTEGLAVTPNDFSVALNPTETTAQSLTFTNTGTSVTKTIKITVQVADATDGTLLDEKSFIVTVLAQGTETATLKVTVKIKDTGKPIENANVTVSFGSSNTTGVTNADGVVSFDMGAMISGNVTVSVRETSSYYGDSVNVTMHSGLIEFTLELVGKSTQETDYTLFMIVIAVLIIIVVAIAGVYLYKKRQLRLTEE